VSNSLAIATVTETLRQLLQVAADRDLPGTTVTMTRPADAAASQGSVINLFLYRVTPDPAFRNDDLPTRTPDGTVRRRPQAALDLHYLVSVSGNDAQLESHRLLGTVVRTLHGRPMLTRQMITDALGGTTLGFLANSDLVDQVELVKVTPSGLSLEEVSNLWSSFFETPFLLSVTYEASVVLIEGDEAPMTALPVHERRVRVLPFRQPRIERVTAADGPAAPIRAGTTLHVAGQGLRGDVTRIRLGGRLLTPTSVGDALVTLSLSAPPLPAAALRAGVHGVQVVHGVLLDTPADPHRGFESNVAPFVLQPTVTAASVTVGTLAVDVEPPVAEGQRVVVLLNENAPGGVSHAFPVAPVTAPTSSLQVDASDIGAGEYFVRVQVDGADSPLDLDPASPDFGPTVTFP